MNKQKFMKTSTFSCFGEVCTSEKYETNEKVGLHINLRICLVKKNVLLKKSC